MEGCEELVFGGWKKGWTRIGKRRGSECGRLQVRRAERQVACARCLDAGADDVIAKPFAFTELAARVRAVRRRAMSVRLQLVHLVMDRLGHSLQRSGHAIDLSPKEFALPEFQKRHAGQPVSRRRLLSKRGV